MEKDELSSRILVVDDMEDNRLILARRLSRLGYWAQPEGSARKAVADILSSPPDLVVLDYMMPEMSGPEVLKEIRKRFDQVNLPVIMVTARSEEETVVECLTAGANDFVSKPVSFPVLRARIEAQIERRRAARALGDLNRELERKVAERTRELIERNETLALAFQELEKADQAKSMFLAGVSHELRTPLNAIIGLSELLHKQVVGPTEPEKLRSFAAEIQRSGRYLLDIVSGILEATSFEKGIVRMNASPANLGEIVAECVTMVENAGQRSGPRLRMTGRPNSAIVSVDRSKIKQAITNILANAVKFTPPDGTVTLRCSTGNGSAEVEIADEGPGIPAAQRLAALMPFVQIYGDQTVKPEGIGLGLHIANLIVKHHGGRLELRGRAPQGLSVLMTLPLATSGD